MHYDDERCVMQLRPVADRSLTTSRPLLSILSASSHSVNCGAPSTSVNGRRHHCSPCTPTFDRRRFSERRSQSAFTAGSFDQLARPHLFFPTVSSYLKSGCLIACPQSFAATALFLCCESCTTRVRTKAGRPNRSTTARIEAPCVSPGPPDATPARAAVATARAWDHEPQALNARRWVR
jgi:hypothetical protein